MRKFYGLRMKQGRFPSQDPIPGYFVLLITTTLYHAEMGAA